MNEASWYFSHQNTRQGPVATTALRQMLAAGQLQPDALVWRDGMANWQAISAVPELQAVMPPPLPGAGVAPIPVSSLGYATPGYVNPGERPPGIGDDAGIRLLIPVGRSGWAIASGYLGLFSLFPVVGVLPAIGAIVTGILAIRDIKKNSHRHGMGRAIFGITAGVIFTVVWLIVLIPVVLRGRF